MENDQSHRNNKPRTFGRWLGINCLAMGLQFLLALILLISHEAAGVTVYDLVPILLLVSGFIYFFLYMVFTRDRAFPFRLKPFLLGAVFAVPLAFLSSYLLRLFLDSNQNQVLKKIIEDGPNYLIFFYPVVVAPICGELFFRKLGHEYLENYSKIAQTMILSAFFALPYLRITGNFLNDLLPVLGGFLISVLNSTLYLKTGSIWSSISLHMFNNLLAIFLV